MSTDPSEHRARLSGVAQSILEEVRPDVLVVRDGVEPRGADADLPSTLTADLYGGPSRSGPSLLPLFARHQRARPPLKAQLRLRLSMVERYAAR